MEVVLLEEPLADRRPHPQPHRQRHDGRELLGRRLAAEQVHRVHQRAAAAELERVEVAVGLEHRGEVQALLGGDAAPEAVADADLRGDRRRGRRPPRARRAPPAGPAGPGSPSEPPYLSLRRFSPGARNDEIR